MKPNLRTFIDYIKKFPNKKICMRLLYKDYKVEKEERDKWRQAFDLISENLNAGKNGTGIEAESKEEGVEGET